MAWFKRNRDEAPADENPGTVAPEPDMVITAPGPAAAGPSTGMPAWSTAAPMPMVTPTIQRVLGGVDARGGTTLGQPAPLSLAPLGHAVTPDAPVGIISVLATADHADGHRNGPAARERPVLDYVQPAPAASPSPGPATPTQLLVPSFQTSRLPSIPAAAPEVQRSATSPSFTTAPSPGPTLVLPVGEVISSAPVGRAADALSPEAVTAIPASTEAPLLATPRDPGGDAHAASAEVQRATAVELPLSPIQRHRDHPGHVDGDEAPPETGATDLQRATLDAPEARVVPTSGLPAPQEGPLLAQDPLAPSAPRPERAAPPAGTVPGVYLPLVARHAEDAGQADGDRVPAEPAPAEVQRAPADATSTPLADVPLVGGAAPLAAPAGEPAPEPPARGAVPELPRPGVQRRAIPRRPTGLGPPIAAVPPGAGQPGAIQRAPLGTSPDAHRATSPLVGAESPVPPPVLPAGSEVDEPAGTSSTGPRGDVGGPTLDLVQRSPADAGSATTAPGAAGPAASSIAPLVGEAPPSPSHAGIDRHGSGDDGAADLAAPPVPGPELELVQRATAAAGHSAPTSAGSTASSSSSAPSPATAWLPPLLVAPLIGGRPFSTVQRAADPAASAAAGLVDRTGPEALSPEPGRVYQPLAGIGMWNGAPPPDLHGPAIEASPSQVAAAVQRSLGTDVSNVRIRRDTGLVAQRLSARAFTSDGEVHIPAAIGRLDSGEGAGLVTHELVHAGQQSVLGSSRPHEHTQDGQHLEAQARSAEQASFAGLELPRMPLTAPAPVVQRAPAEGGGGASPFSPQQLSTLMGLADNLPSGTTAVQRMDVSAGPPPALPGDVEAPPEIPDAGQHQQTPQELEELATKLFPALRNLFRSELLGFRRRSGTSSDRPLS